MKILMTTILTLLSLSFIGCDEPFENGGDTVTEERILESFNRVEIDGCIDVTYKISDETKVEIRAGENHMDDIFTTVIGDKLVFDEDVNFNWNHSVSATLYGPDLSEITIDGSGSFDASEMEGDEINLKIEGSGDIDIEANYTEIKSSISGSGDIDITGDAEIMDVTISGSGRVDARHLDVQDCQVVVAGSGDSYVNVSESLDITISGSGDVHYWGNPSSVQSNVNGSGDIIQH